MLRFKLRGGSLALGARHAGDLLQRGSEAKGVARELDRRGIGEVFTLTGDRRLDDLGEEDAARADNQHDEARHDHAQSDGRGVLTPHRTGQTEEDIAELGQRGQAGDGTDNAQA